MRPTPPPARADYVVSTNKRRLDFIAIHRFLTHSPWSPGIAFETVQRAIANSICFGLFHGTEQIGFARVVTDRATFAYLADVYVLEAYRGRGLAKWLVDTVVSDRRLRDIRRFLLITGTAAGLYRQSGFNEFPHPTRLMERPSVDRC